MADKEDLKKKKRIELMLLIGLAIVGGVIIFNQTLPVLLPRGGKGAGASRQLALLPAAGLGGEKVIIPEGPKSAAPLPPYKERDPFRYGGTTAESAALSAGTVKPTETKTTEEQLTLEDIFEDNGKFIAAINGDEYKVGERVSDWIVDSISASQVTLRKGKTRKVLKMEE